MPEAKTPETLPADGPDPLQLLHDEIVGAKREFLLVTQKNDPTPQALATFIEGTLLSLLQETVVQLATTREDLIVYVDEAIEAMADGTQIEPEHAAVFLELIAGTRLLIEEVRKGSSHLSDDAKKSLAALAAKADEAERVVLDHALEDEDDGEDEDEDEDEDDEDSN